MGRAGRRLTDGRGIRQAPSMYKLIGADGKEYGPVSAEQLRQWIHEGRANYETLILTENAVEWRPLGAFSEFAAALTSATPAAPQTIRPFASTAPMGTNWMSVAGFILGVFSLPSCCCCLISLPCSILGIIFSAMALSQLKHEPMRGGRGLAIAGLVLAIIGLIFTLFFMFGGLMNGMADPSATVNGGE